MGIQLLAAELSKLFLHLDADGRDLELESNPLDSNGNSRKNSCRDRDRDRDGDYEHTVSQGMGIEARTRTQTDSRVSCEGILSDINDSLRISLDILNDLLLVDKIEEGGITLDTRTLNARELFKKSIQNFNVQANFANISLTSDLQALSCVTVCADEMKIAQVIRNILSNALKFTPSGGHIQVQTTFQLDPPPSTKSSLSESNMSLKGLRSGSFATIQPASTKEKGRIRIEILDTGPGMSDDNKSKLFTSVIQFNQNELQSGGGSGLGMYISNAILRQHPGGAIGVLPEGVLSQRRGDGTVELQPCKSSTQGCVFYIELPAHKRLSDNVVPFSFVSVESERIGGGGCVTIRSSSSFQFRDADEEKGYEKGPNFQEQSFRERSQRRGASNASPIMGTARTRRVGQCSGSYSQRVLAGAVEVIDNLEGDLEEGVVEEDVIMFEKVLVVEDSKLNRKMMKKTLMSYAKEIVMAEDGVEGVAAVRDCIAQQAAHFDVIFMDSLMPNMNGIDASKVILRELNFPNPIIAITGNMLPDDVKEFEEAGALTVLGKPLQLDKLDEVLNGIHLSKKPNLLLTSASFDEENE